MRTEAAIAALGALAHETRLAVWRMLIEAGPQGLAAGIIAARLRIAPSSLTFHLQHLCRAGLATQRRASRQLIYAADFAAMNEFIAYLTKNCCGTGVSCAPVCNPGRSAAVAAAAPTGTRRVRTSGARRT